MKSHFIAVRGNEREEVLLEGIGDQRYRLTVGDEQIEFEGIDLGEGRLRLLHGDHVYDLLVHEHERGRFSIHRRGHRCEMQLLDESQMTRLIVGGPAERSGEGAVTAPMPGKVVKLLVGEGSEVEAGQGLVVVEAMKMENQLASNASGTVKSVLVSAGDSVEAGQALVLIE